MKKKMLVMVASVFTAGLLLAGSVYATGSGDDSGKRANVSLGQSDVVDGAYYGVGQTVTVAGTVKGDVYCAGKNVIVSGTVEGDVICAGQTLKVSGSVKGDIRAAGQVVTIDGNVDKNVTVFGETVDITKSAKIGGDLNGAAESITFDGNVKRDVAFRGTSVVVSGLVGRNMDMNVDNFSINDGAAINGNVNYTSENKASVAENTVKGDLHYTKQETDDRSSQSMAAAWTSALYMVLALALVALVLVLIAPQLFHAVAKVGLTRLGMTIMVGVFLLLAAPLVVTLTAMTVIGIPLAILLGLTWILVLLVSGPVFAYYLGRLLLSKYSDNAVASMMMGIAVLAILLLIPIVNVITAVVTAIVGSGMVGLYTVSHQKKPRYTVK